MTLDNKYTGLGDLPLNEAQQLLVPFMGTEDNVIFIAPTSVGKSTIISMLGHSKLEENKTILYIGVTKSLVEQKQRDWAKETHPWKDLPKAIITGDYQKSKEQQRQIDEAKLIVITPESLMSRIRQRSSEASGFLSNVGLIILDEVHLTGQESRGPNYEAAVIEFGFDYPDCPILALSATVPNADDLKTWLGNVNNKTTYLIKSDYRPVPLEYHELPQDKGSKTMVEDQTLRDIADVCKEYDEQILIPVWSRAFGNKIVAALNHYGLTSVDFHHAQVPKVLRDRMEKRFEHGSLRIMVCTSTVIAGLNMPVYVSILSQMSNAGGEVSTAELQQAAGRAGRTGYHTEGHVYVCAPAQEMKYHLNRLMNGQRVDSWMLDKTVLASHTLAAIYMLRINNEKSFLGWYKRTLAYVQKKPTDEVIAKLWNSIHEDMVKRGFIMKTAVKLTQRGKIVAQMLMDPYHVFDLVMNFKKYLTYDSPTDVDLAKCLGSVRPFATEWISKAEEEDVPKAIKKACKDVYWKSCACFAYQLKGEDVPESLTSTLMPVMEDLNRVQECMVRINNEDVGWDEENRIRMIFTRVRNRCDWNKARGIVAKFRKGELTTLNRLGIYSLEDAKRNMDTVKEVLKPSRLQELGLN